MKGHIEVILWTGHVLKSGIIEDEAWEKSLSDESKEDFKDVIGSAHGNLDITLANGDWVVLPLRSVLYVRFVAEQEEF